MTQCFGEQPMSTRSNCFILRLALALLCLSQLHAQTATNPSADPNGKRSNVQPAGQAPDEMTKKIADLVHAGKYAEAQQLTTGLLVAYPDDQRLIRAKALIETLLAPAGSASATPGSNQPINTVAPAQPAVNASAAQPTGMDRVEYNSLIELARQAQQTTDLEQQNALLKQFMDKSHAFLQKYPNEMLLWQLRAASAMSLHEADAGYEAGQKLLADGAADSSNPNLQQLLSKLNLEGWLDKQKVEDYKKDRWFLGTWNSSWSDSDAPGDVRAQGNVVFSQSESGDIKSYGLQDDGKYGGNVFRGTILNAGEIKWERYLDSRLGCCPSGWQPVISSEIGGDRRTMKLIVPSQWATERDSQKGSRQRPNIYVLTKISDSQSH
jgi:hypothetical protein